MPKFRWLFNRLSALCAAVTLLLCIAALATELFPFEPKLTSPPLPIGTTRVVALSDGRLHVRDITYVAVGPYVFPKVDSTVLYIPFGPMAIACAVLPILWLLDRQAGGGNMYRCGLCQTCGYDLRASRNRCPECGTPRPRHS